jgi:hypothetical protein
MLTASVSGGDKWKAALAKLSNVRPELRVGILEPSTNEEGEKIARYAAYNEYGTPRGIPPRPFMRNTLAEKKGEWLRIIRSRASANPDDIRGAFELAGEVASKDVMKTIEDGQFEALADSTVEKKRNRGKTHVNKKGAKPASNNPEHPLIDTGAMQEAITYEVVNG